MTDAEFDLCEFAEPDFEDFNELWRRVETFLQMEGVDPVARPRRHPHEPATVRSAALINVAPASPRSR